MVRRRPHFRFRPGSFWGGAWAPGESYKVWGGQGAGAAQGRGSRRGPPPHRPRLRDPRPPISLPPRLGAELARGAQRGTPSGGPLAGAAELAGRAGLPGEGPPQTRLPPPPWPGRRREGAARSARPPSAQPAGERGPRRGRPRGPCGAGVAAAPVGCPGPGERRAPASGKWPLRRGAESAQRPPPGALNLEPGGRLARRRAGAATRPAREMPEPRPRADPGPSAARTGSQPGGVTRSRPGAPQAG